MTALWTVPPAESPRGGTFLPRSPSHPYGRFFLRRTERRNGLAHRMVGGKFAEAVALDMQGAVEACAQVLESDHGGQFDDLGRVEVPLQIVEGRIGDLCGRARHP